MSQDEYDDWRATNLAAYAVEMAEAGRLPLEQARVRAEQQHAEFLPEGLATPRMHLLRVLDRGEPVGILWVGPHPRKADAGFVYDVEIEERRRGQGLGRRTMLAAERIAREEGWAEIALNVFGPNLRARALYDSLGYEVVSTSMRKPLA